MEFKISKQVLSKLLARVAPAVADKSPIEVVKCFMIRAESNCRVSVVGTDLVTAVTAHATAEVKTPGSLLVPAKLFQDMVSNLPQGEATLTSKDGKVFLKAVASKTRYQLQCRPADDFPAIPQSKGPAQLTVPSRDLGRILGKASYAQHGHDDSRMFMHCTRIVAGDGAVRAVAVDGHRLGKASFVADGVGKFEESIPGRIVKTIEKLCADFGEHDVSVSVANAGESDGFIHVAWPELALAVKRGDQAFPPWRSVLPDGFAERLRMPRAALIDAIKRAQVASDPGKAGTKPVHLLLEDGSLKVTSDKSDKGESSDEVDVAYSGKSWKSGAASEYLLQGLAAIDDDDVLMCLNPEDSRGNPTPIVFVGATDEAATYALIVPMKL